ncbi:MAG: hypothetical protein EBU90_13465 [Proteobacteria bacterium]|nr:hypothetical protein [Pseudomonadota bacterium]
MKFSDEYINHIAKLAKEVEVEDPIDWGIIPISEDVTYRMMATSVLEQFGDMTQQRDIMIATIVKLVVENFILNLRLMKNGIKVI